MSALPPAYAVRRMVTLLLDRRVGIEPAQRPVVPRTGAPCASAVFVTDCLQFGALVVCELGLAAQVSAALGLHPPRAAAAAVREGRLPGALGENFHELMDIFASLFNGPDAPHLRLYQVCEPAAALPADLVPLLATGRRRADFALSIDGYGGGRLGILLPPAAPCR